VARFQHVVVLDHLETTRRQIGTNTRCRALGL
jgi:hypothetical protein